MRTFFKNIISAGIISLFAFTCLSDSVVVFNEIMYHPAGNESQMEWIELHNQMAVDIDLSDWSIAGGIDFRDGAIHHCSGRGSYDPGTVCG